VPGLDFGYRMLTRVLPLGRAAVTERDGELYIGGWALRGGRPCAGRCLRISSRFRGEEEPLTVPIIPGRVPEAATPEGDAVPVGDGPSAWRSSRSSSPTACWRSS